MFSEDDLEDYPGSREALLGLVRRGKIEFRRVWTHRAWESLSTRGGLYDMRQALRAKRAEVLLTRGRVLAQRIGPVFGEAGLFG